MAETPEQKLPSIAPPVEVKLPGPTAEEILNEAKVLMAKLAEYGTNAGAILTALNVTANEAKTSEAKIASSLVNAQVKLDEITNAATQALASRTKISDEEAVIATKSAHINDAQKYADTVRADLDRELTAAKTSVSATEAERTSAQSSATTSAALLKDIQQIKTGLDTDAGKIATALTTAGESALATKALAEKSIEVESRIAAYEKRLLEFDQQSAAKLKIIEGLLPGATAAGLASSFDARRITFLKPHNRWQFLFVASILAIVGLASTSLIHIYFAATPPTYEELLRLWLSRVPVAGALVWLALHASHESALAKRLEEDYGYKVAVAKCLLGFQNQIAEVGKNTANNPALAKLLENTLTTIAAPPGRIYDKHELAASPSGELAEAAKAVLAAYGKKSS